MSKYDRSLLKMDIFVAQTSNVTYSAPGWIKRKAESGVEELLHNIPWLIRMKRTRHLP